MTYIGGTPGEIGVIEKAAALERKLKRQDDLRRKREQARQLEREKRRIRAESAAVDQDSTKETESILPDCSRCKSKKSGTVKLDEKIYCAECALKQTKK